MRPRERFRVFRNTQMDVRMDISHKLKTARMLLDKYQDIKSEIDRKFDSSKYKRACEQYAYYLKTMPVKSRTVLYESNYGRGIVDNPYALFLHIIADERFDKFQHYWVVEDMSQVDRLPDCFHDKRVHFVVHESKEYLKALATCKYLLNNSTFLSYFAKRDEQVYINTWHGTPLKCMGYDINDGALASGNVVRNMLSADYLLAANEIMANMYLNSYRMKGIFKGRIIQEGYPRTDLSFAADRQDVLNMLALYGVEFDPEKRIILYAPTWKASGNTNTGIDAAINAEELLRVKREIELRIEGSQYQVLVKPHNYVYKLIKDMPEYTGKFVPSDIDANEIMAAVDMLISDFSSIMFDFLALDRPILLYVPDLDEYAHERGLAFGLDEMPGPYTKDLDEVIDYIKRIANGDDEYRDKRESMMARICPCDDGNVCERVIQAVFLGERTPFTYDASTSKKRILIAGGSVNRNGITQSLLALLNQIDYERYDVTVYLSKGSADIRSYVNAIPSGARVMMRVGGLLDTRMEESLREMLDDSDRSNAWLRRAYPEHIFAREYRRCFGLSDFDVAIDYNGYERINASIIAESAASKRLIWLHSDMASDAKRVVDGVLKNGKSLNYISSLYPKFDKLVSCSKTLSDVNSNNFPDDNLNGRFTYVHNCFSVYRIEAGLAEPPLVYEGVDYYVRPFGGPLANVELLHLPSEDDITFIAVGRLSPEKNYENLIRAFARLRKEYEKVKLYILGEGPLRDDLEELCNALNLNDSVYMPGNVANPFAFLKRSDCFVLPSFYEGQPMVIFEARSCGLPIVVSNFASVADSLVPGGQLVVGFDAKSIYGGLRSFVLGEVPTVTISLEEYNKSANAEFEAVLE